MNEFMPLALLPLEDPNHDPGEHQVIDAETSHIFKIMGSRERAEDLVRSVNGAEIVRSIWEDQRTRINVRRDYPELAAAIDKLVGHEPQPACTHPNAKVWFYRDDDTYMRCEDCGSRWSVPR